MFFQCFVGVIIVLPIYTDECIEIVQLKVPRIKVQQKELGFASRYLNDALAGREGQSHQARPIYGHDLISDVDPAGLLGWASVHHAGDDDGRKDGAPP